MHRRQIKTFILVAISLLLLILLTSCGHTAAIKHSGFEEGSDDSIKGWILYDYHEQKADPLRTIFSIVPSGYSGNCLKIESKNVNDARVYQEIKVKRNRLYKVTVMVKTENVEGGNGVNISAIDAMEYSDPIMGTHDEWQEINAYIRTGKKQKTLNLSFNLGGYGNEASGIVYFDEISIEEIKTLPSGEKEINLAPKEKEKDKEKMTAHELLMKGIFLVAIVSLLVFVIVLCIRSDKEKANKLTPLSYEITRPTKKDWLIIGLITLVVAFISFYKLGNMKAASNYWKASESGEYVIVEFDSEKEVTKLSYSCNIPASASYKVFYEDENGDFKKATDLKQHTFFEWKILSVRFTTKRVKIEATSPGLGINELGFFEANEDGDLVLIPLNVVEEHYTEEKGYGKPSYLFDEQDTVPIKPSYMNSTYFDELYFPRTAYEHIHGLKVYENTHPPLGKDIMALGILIFGMNPFGWRFMGTLAGVLLVPIMYLFALKLFKKRPYAFLAAFLMAFDFMRLAQTRLATIDSYSCLFVLLMYYFMYDYFVVKSYDLTFKRSLRPLVFAGIMFGLGAAAKWTSLYGGAGIAILFFLAKYAEFDDYYANRVGEDKGTLKSWLSLNFAPTILACLVLFVVVPGIIYVASYIPYIGPSQGKSLLKIVVDNQEHMYKYHAGLTAEHSFGSAWYTWPIIVRPIWYYIYGHSDPGMRSTIASFGNPAIWWVGIFAIVYSVYKAWKKKDKYMIPVFVGYGLQFFPWILVTRVAFIYHYFTAVPFMIFMIVYAAKNLIEDKVINKKIIWVYMAIVLVLFIAFYPVLTGLEVKEWYVKLLRLFSSWYF